MSVFESVLGKIVNEVMPDTKIQCVRHGLQPTRLVNHRVGLTCVACLEEQLDASAAELIDEAIPLD